MSTRRTDALREALGGAHPLAVNKVGDHLQPLQIAFVHRAPFAVMASADAQGRCDASPKGGRPGFVQVVDARTLLVPDYGGNRLFQSYANFESNARAGFVFMIPGLDVTLRVNGSVTVLEAEALAARGLVAEVLRQDEPERLNQGLLLHVEEAYFHCPRAFRFAALWDVGAIADVVGRPLKEVLEDPGAR